jgi:hypothetical protein
MVGLALRRKADLLAEVLQVDRRQQDEINDDLKHGQIVIIWARWAVVVFAFAMRLYRPDDLTELVISVLGLIAVALVNFALHIQVLMKRPPRIRLVYFASAMDICLITLITGMQGGARSHVFVYYFPAVLAFALVFPSRITIGLTSAVMVMYTGLSLLVSDPGLQAGDETMLIFRLLALAGVAMVGNRYRAVEAGRRNRTSDVERQLDEVLRRQAGPDKIAAEGVNS